MGAIIYWGLIRIAIIIPVIWILNSYLDYSLWWSVSFLLIYGVVLHPAIIQYNLFKERNKDIIESTLCSSCKYFDETAVLCLKLDEHPTREYLPCDGLSWEPISVEDKNEESYH
jgi:glucan phosphoethanolaminetransferase (alkaline phosphatase superfamily)